MRQHKGLILQPFKLSAQKSHLCTEIDHLLRPEHQAVLCRAGILRSPARAPISKELFSTGQVQRCTEWPKSRRQQNLPCITMGPYMHADLSWSFQRRSRPKAGVAGPGCPLMHVKGGVQTSWGGWSREAPAAAGTRRCRGPRSACSMSLFSPSITPCCSASSCECLRASHHPHVSQGSPCSYDAAEACTKPGCWQSDWLMVASYNQDNFARAGLKCCLYAAAFTRHHHQTFVADIWRPIICSWHWS